MLTLIKLSYNSVVKEHDKKNTNWASDLEHSHFQKKYNSGF